MMIYIFINLFSLLSISSTRIQLQGSIRSPQVADGHQQMLASGRVYSFTQQVVLMPVIKCLLCARTLPDAEDTVVSGTGDVPTHKELTF